MSKAEIRCPKCSHEWTYSGLSKDSAYCPNCSNKIQLDAPCAEVVEHFGIPDKH